MHEAMQEAIKEFVSQFHKIAGDNIQSVAIVVTGSSAIADPSKELVMHSNGIINITYQTQTIPSPVHTDVTIIVTK
jgi:hypothetical protein